METWRETSTSGYCSREMRCNSKVVYCCFNFVVIIVKMSILHKLKLGEDYLAKSTEKQKLSSAKGYDAYKIRFLSFSNDQ